jgi:enoyl-CoA hydratase/carnithine racemase
MIGDSHTRERLLGGSLFSGQQAFSIGLAHDVVAAPADVRARAIELAQALAAKPAPALRATRELLSHIDGSDTDAAFDAALAASISLVGGHEQHRLLGAFVNAPRSV